jgi:hypothetical protein
MSAKTTHVFPVNGGWAVRKEGSAKRTRGVYTTQRKAIAVARDMALRASAGQVVIHGRDGSMRSKYLHGMPVVQTPPRKSDLGTKAIERAVSAVIRERL